MMEIRRILSIQGEDSEDSGNEGSAEGRRSEGSEGSDGSEGWDAMARGESEGDEGGEVEGWGGRMLWRGGAKAAKRW